MDSDAHPKPICSWLLTVVLLMAIVGLFIAIAIPNFIGGGPGKISSVINMLRQIDAAKQEWTIEHGFTNGVAPSHEMTQQDFAQLFIHGDDKDHFDRFGFGIDRNGNIHGAQGVVFAINPLGISPEAKFTKGFMLDDRDWFYGPKIPKNTILRFGANGEEYILPGQESKPCNSLSELLSR
jgi:hypothetical protein